MTLRELRDLRQFVTIVDGPAFGTGNAASFTQAADFDHGGHSTNRGLLGLGIADQVNVHNKVDGLRDQAVHGKLGQARVRLRHVVRQTLQHDVGRVGMDRCQRTALTHRGDVEHVECLVFHQLADDDAVGVEPARQLDQLARRDFALAFSIGMTREQRRRIRVARVVFEPQLEQVLLDRDDAFERRDLAQEFGQERRLSGAGRAGHKNGEAAAHEGTELLDHRLGEEAEIGEAVQARLADNESSDGDARMRRDTVLGVATQNHDDARSVV